MNIIGKKTGIVGGGQLGKMMILEAKRLGFFVAVLDPDPVCSAASICDALIVADLHDEAAFVQFARQVDVITYEFENINAAALEKLEQQGHVIYPSVKSLKTIQNKLLQKQALESAGIPVPRFVKVQSTQDVAKAGETFGYPMMLKTTTGGYDGYGNALVRDVASIEAAYQKLGAGAKELMVEAFVPFEKEVSIIATRGIDGARAIYPVAENHHENSRLDTTIVPARIDEQASKRVGEVADRVMELFEGVGTFGIELFVTKDGNVLVNEVAPRPHNSGHYTIEGCLVNQFENHVRAIVGLPLGDSTLKQPTVMVNLLGESDGPTQVEGLTQVYEDPMVKVHLYGKPQAKIHRKMGHITAIDQTVEGAITRAEKARVLVHVVGNKQ